MAGHEEQPAQHDRAPIAELAVRDDAADDRAGIDEHQVGGPDARRAVLGPAEAALSVRVAVGDIQGPDPAHGVEAEALPHLGEEQDVEALRMRLLDGGYAHQCTPLISLRIGRASSARIRPAPAVMANTAPKSCGSGSFSNCPATRPAIRLPSAIDMNQMPIICPTLRCGASLVTVESPTGDRQSSPQVWNR